MHVFPNGKKYIGITCQKPEARWKKGNGYAGQYVYKFICEYGWENISHIILKKDMSEDEALNFESEMIKKYDSIKNGYNIAEYGDGMLEPWTVFNYNGKQYSPEELLELSTVEDLTCHDLTTRINHHGWDIDRALTQPKSKKKNGYEYNGKLYTYKELYNFVKDKSISINNLRDRLSRGWDVKRAISQPTNKKKQPKGVGERIYEYNGVLYNSYELSEISEVEGITPFDITDRIKHHGWSVERAISQPKRKRIY